MMCLHNWLSHASLKMSFLLLPDRTSCCLTKTCHSQTFRMMSGIAKAGMQVSFNKTTKHHKLPLLSLPLKSQTKANPNLLLKTQTFITPIYTGYKI